MAYSKTVWNNNTPPDISAENLNKMEQGIYDAQFPDGGSTGQILSKTNDGTGWVDAPTSAEWGNITGQLYEQTDLVAALDAKANTSTLATVESTSTASQAYSVGDYLVYNGILYKVISAINSGETLTPNTNIEATTTGAELTSLNSNLSQKVSSVNGETPDTNGNVQIDATNIDTSSGVAIKSVSGNPVTIADALQGKALGVTATLEPIQSGSGTPSPTNVRPITGRTSVNVTRTGKNLCPPVTIGLNYDNNTGKESYSDTQAGSAKFPFDKDKTYVFTKNCNVNVMFFAWDAQGNFVGRVTGSNESPRVFNKSNFTIGKGTKDYDSITQIAVKFYQSSNQNIDDVVGAEYQLYEQGTEKSVTVNLGRTVYGGTLNITDGELSVETANIASYNGESIGEPWWSSVDEYVAGATPTTGAQVVYTLATPTTVTLTPAQIQLLTTTNIISTNADDLSVRYYPTGQTGNVEGNLSFLLDKTANNETAVDTVSESIAPTETGTATQNYATGSYLMLNNRLCKVTAAIATGEQIIVGSNVQYTTVAEELTAILAQINA